MPMSCSRNPRRPWIPAVAAVALALLAPGFAAPTAPASESTLDPAEILLRDLHPDYQTCVHAVHPMANAAGAASVYMVLVRGGAADPLRRESAPFAVPGARNGLLSGLRG